MKIIIPTRALAVFIGMHSEPPVDPVFHVDSFEFESEKSVGEWEREFARSGFAMFNSQLINYGNEQRRVRKKTS